MTRLIGACYTSVFLWLLRDNAMSIPGLPVLWPSFPRRGPDVFSLSNDRDFFLHASLISGFQTLSWTLRFHMSQACFIIAFICQKCCKQYICAATLSTLANNLPLSGKNALSVQRWLKEMTQQCDWAALAQRGQRSVALNYDVVTRRGKTCVDLCNTLARQQIELESCSNTLKQWFLLNWEARDVYKGGVRNVNLYEAYLKTLLQPPLWTVSCCRLLKMQQPYIST